MSSQKNSTTGRALSMASMGAGIAGSYAGYLLQRAFLGEAKSRIKLKSTHTRAARKMADEMQALRGPAMKIQYPGNRRAIENDFSLFRAFAKPAQASGYIPKSAIDEIEKQIVAETDYEREADNIDFLGDRLAPLSFVKVPRVFRKYSSDKVLTMSLMTGGHLEDCLAQRPSQTLRNQLASDRFELFYCQVLKIEALHADPHWGNYLFNEDASISLVDFGCVKYLSPESVAYLRSVFLYPGETDSANFRRLLETYYERVGEKLLPAARRALIRFADNFYRKVYPPKPEKELFDFGDATFLRDYLRESKNLFRTKGVLTEFIFMGRAEMGLYQTLHRLRARVPTSQIVKKYL